jgi:hypothetical protein
MSEAWRTIIINNIQCKTNSNNIKNGDESYLLTAWRVFKNPPISICNISEGKIKLSILDLKGFNVKRETCRHLILCKPGEAWKSMFAVLLILTNTKPGASFVINSSVFFPEMLLKYSKLEKIFKNLNALPLMSLSLIQMTFNILILSS